MLLGEMRFHDNIHETNFKDTDKIQLPFNNLSNYHQISNIRRTEYQNLKVSRLVLQLSLPDLLKSRMKM